MTTLKDFLVTGRNQVSSLWSESSPKIHRKNVKIKSNFSYLCNKETLLDGSFGLVLQNNPDPDLINLGSVSRVTLHAANLKVAVI